MPDFTVKDFLDLGVAGVLAFLLIRQFMEYQKLVSQVTDLVSKCIAVIEANKTAIDRLENQRIIELTQAVREMRKLDQDRQREQQKRAQPDKHTAEDAERT